MTRKPGSIALAAVVAIAAASLASCADESARSTRVVTVFGTLSDADVDDFTASVAGFEASTGIDVRFVGSTNFEADLLERLRRGDPPDLALLPQPGLLDTIVEDGFALPWTGALAAPAVEGVPSELVDLVEFDGQAYGAWYQLTLKSLVWYSPRVFADRGLDVPSSWDELTSMTDALVAEGITPWCIGIRADGATGWVATDWVEDMVLRFAGPDAYDDWVTHRMPFTDDAIVAAFERFGAIALSPSKVAGGNRAAVELTIEESARELLEKPTRCVLHRQASFLPRLTGRSGLTVAPDGDLWAFPLPAADDGTAPLVVGGTVTVRFTDGDDVDQLAGYLATDEAAARRAARGGFVSPRSTVTLDQYSSTLDRFVAGLLSEADVVRFDASDLMPPEVGVGTFWTGMTSWLGGARLRSVLADIDASWPVPLTKPAVPFDAGDTDD